LKQANRTIRKHSLASNFISKPSKAPIFKATHLGHAREPRVNKHHPFPPECKKIRSRRGNQSPLLDHIRRGSLVVGNQFSGAGRGHKGGGGGRARAIFGMQSRSMYAEPRAPAARNERVLHPSQQMTNNRAERNTSKHARRRFALCAASTKRAHAKTPLCVPSYALIDTYLSRSR
jgi:hypothetical protein